MIRKSIAVLLAAACVALAGCGGGKKGSPAETQEDKKALMEAEAELKEELGLSSAEELDVAVGILKKETDAELVDDLIAMKSLSSSEKATYVESFLASWKVAKTKMTQYRDSEEFVEAVGKAKAKVRSLQAKVTEREAELKKLYKDATDKNASVKTGQIYVMKTEVTQGLYIAVRERPSPSKYKKDGYSLFPVENVTWYGALSFCNMLSEKQGLKPCYSVNGSSDTSSWPNWNDGELNADDVEWDKTANGWRLPTEEEWLAAAGDGNTYSGSNNIDDVAWYKENSGGHPQKVGTKAANANGLYDMSGNVWEWCWDQEEGKCVIRGGGWGTGSDKCDISARSVEKPDSFSDYRGFRVVRNVK